ncbi:MAG TPA: SpoIIE family protein phosphatase, partial [Leptospiraceae bacterium]|nr:SpoIIE family protein phosphatase [Leptospiraceae bacterium]
IGLGIYIYTRTSAIFEHPWDTTLIQRVELIVLYPVIFFNFALQEELFFQRIRKVTKYYGYFLFLWSFITIFIPMYIAEYLLRFWQLTFITLGIGIAVNIIYTSVKNKIPNAKRLMTGMIILTFSAVFDVMDSLVLNTGLAFSKYAFFIYVFGFATILANNFIQVHNEIEHLNDTLERKVIERTKELTNSLEKVNQLKKQQDGDYYLTSLLLNPLGVNHAIKKGVDIEFIIQQKKKFTFKGNDSELGGDLCRTETISLKNRQFTVFFNADAMGKSMQGAGGAIVVGAVFDSIIERTKLSKVVQNYHPERWLKNSFVELHKVFESFDCTMLVSIVVGLVDNASGLIYYINAEHPFPVLYRDGKASFIGDDFIYRKLGTPVNETAYISVDTFQLKHGDIFISGSDGRDDIIIKNSLGEKVLNSDEKFFLRVVEDANGDLKTILQILKREDELTDDISLLRIYITENPYPFDMSHLEDIINQKSIIDIEDNKDLPPKELYIRNLKNKFFINIKTNKYEEAIQAGKEYLEWIPADDEMISKLSETFKNAGRIDESIELGERLRLRRKQNIPNLLNLAECYRMQNQIERANLLLKDVLAFDKENKIAKDMISKLV